MKIYRNKKKIESHTLLNEQDMPLSYMANDNIYSDTIIKMNENLLSKNKNESVSLYQKIDRDITLFKQDNKVAVEGKDYITDNDGVITIPNLSKKPPYRPTIFGYKYILQRNITYSSSRIFNIKIDFTGMTKVKKMLDALPLPANVKFTETSENPDIKYFNGEDNYLKAMKSSGYKDNCSIYIVKSNYGNKILYNKPKIFDVKNPSLFTQTEYLIDPDWEIFNHDLEMNVFPKETYDYVKLTIDHTPILILIDKLNFKIIILCGKEIFTQERLTKFLAENIIYAYRLGYTKYPEGKDDFLRAFISTNIIDYYYNTNNNFKAYHPAINLAKDIPSIDNSYKLVYVETTDKNVSFDYITQTKDIYFKKTLNDEPKKEPNESLLFTINNELMFINGDSTSLYEIESIPHISYIYKDNKLILNIGPYISSLYGIAKKESTKLIINDVNKNYILYMKKTKILTDQKFYVSDKENKDDIKIADIITKFDKNISLVDTRVIGGGSSKFNNYEFIDTGNKLGRPYRAGTAMVITIPRKYEQYRDILQEQINKHIASSEAAILICKD